jgi:catechol 2,3-dioxygenase-like lactoylglutathione lyase family enzyme
MKLHGVLESVLYCHDLESSERFYSDILGLERIAAREGRHVFFRCGDGVVLLFDPEQASTVPTEVDGNPIPLHGAKGAGHLAFRVASAEIEAWRDYLVGKGVEIESEVTWPGGGRSVYFRDPGGNSLEIATPDLWKP